MTPSSSPSLRLLYVVAGVLGIASSRGLLLCVIRIRTCWLGLALTLAMSTGSAASPQTTMPPIPQRAKPQQEKPQRAQPQQAKPRQLKAMKPLPPIIAGADAQRLLSDPKASQQIQWLYSGSATLTPPLDVAQRINWQDFVHTDKDGIKWRINAPSLVTKELTSRFKLDPKRPVVVFGDSITKFLVVSSGWGEEGRIAWMLEQSGFQQVSVVDGGYKAILAKDPSLASQNPLPARDKRGETKAIDYEQLSAGLKENANPWVVLDTRSWEEYRGLLSYVRRKGRIPGAFHFHVNDFFDSKGKIRSKEELLTKLAAKGIDGKKPIVTYCSGGVRSAMAYYLLRYHLGFDQVANYDGSWAEWSVRHAPQ